MAIQWHEREKVADVVKENLMLADTVLDIGCGIMPQNYIVPLVQICCDPFEQYVEHLKTRVETEIDGTFLILKAGWNDIAEKLPPNCVDSVFLLDIIEHLEKEEGRHLVQLTERIAKKQIIIFTPIGYLPQEREGKTDAWGLNGADYQDHKSGWFPDKDFDDSWDIYACSDYHIVNNLGHPLEKPCGAFWAIKNLSSHGSPGKKTSIVEDVNTVLRALGVDLLNLEEYLSTVLVRTAKAVKKIQTLKTEETAYINEISRLTHEMQVLNSMVQKLQNSDAYRLGQKITNIPWFFKFLKFLLRIWQHFSTKLKLIICFCNKG
jgi:hypothetical protein